MSKILLTTVILFEAWTLFCKYSFTLAFSINDKKLYQRWNTGTWKGTLFSSRFVSDISAEIQEIKPAGLRSRIQAIRSYNLAGLKNSPDGKDINIVFENNNDFVAVTGETGSGKSVLVARAIELICGGKAGPFVVDKSENSNSVQSAAVEITVLLTNAHLSAAKVALNRIGLSSSKVFPRGDQQVASLRFRRTLVVQPASSSSKARLRSICDINGVRVTLKAFGAISGFLLTSVDSGMAAMALTKSSSRIAVIDAAVPLDYLTAVAEAREEYRNKRKERERLENELSTRILPYSFDSEKDMELLSHWIDELDSFERRTEQFCLPFEGENLSESSLDRLQHDLKFVKWTDNSSDDAGVFSSLMYSKLTEFRNALRVLDEQLAAAHRALEALSSFSSSQSAVTAMERARNFLYDAAGRETGGKVFEATEECHELLNAAEVSLAACTRFLEDDSRGLISTLETLRMSCPISTEDIEELLLDWNTLARKHGISPFVLPSCHRSLRSERDGNVEAKTLLPLAYDAEEIALLQFEASSKVLTTERQKIADALSISVTKRLPSLGMEGYSFKVNLRHPSKQCTDASVYAENSVLGVDVVDFLLLQGEGSADESGGSVHESASSGEKARILLAIECALPGSVGTMCRNIGDPAMVDFKDIWFQVPPVAVLYDEIDAHVGGRAAVAMANMLVDQSRSSQVLAITHSPSVAATADLHVVVRPIGNKNSRLVEVSIVDGAERRKELARMASGDLAPEEAEAFAEALIRDGARAKENNTVTNH